MKEIFLTFRRFNSIEETQELIDLLKTHDIGYELEDATGFDVTFSGNPLNKDFRIKLKQSDFEIVEQLLLSETHVFADQIPADHYLFTFADDELYEIIEKPDEWSAADYKLALQLLKKRVKELSAEAISELKKQRLNQLAQPEESKPIWIYLGLISAVLGGILGTFIGWHLLSYKKTLPNGQCVYGYTKADRKKGETIFYLGLFFTFIWLLVAFTDLKNSVV